MAKKISRNSGESAQARDYSTVKIRADDLAKLRIIAASRKIDIVEALTQVASEAIDRAWRDEIKRQSELADNQGVPQN